MYYILKLLIWIIIKQKYSNISHCFYDFIVISI